MNTNTETQHQLIATCWTTAGNVAPGEDRPSPLSFEERVDAVAQSGWYGMGISELDLEIINMGIGFDAAACCVKEAGLQHFEVELATGWWDQKDYGWREKWELLFAASEAFDASFIKVGTDITERTYRWEDYVAPLQAIAHEAETVGARLAFEAFPFGRIKSIPEAANLVKAVNYEAVGLLIDYWHVFRAGTTLEKLKNSIAEVPVWGVELCDGPLLPVAATTMFEETRDFRELPGQGEQDVAGFVKALRDVGYRGPWGVEVLSAIHRQRPLSALLEEARAAAEAVLETFE